MGRAARATAVASQPCTVPGCRGEVTYHEVSDSRHCTACAARLRRESLEQATDRCLVPGCGGVLVFPTNGSGSVLAYCEDCERRVARERLMGQRLPPAALTDQQLASLVRQRTLSVREALRLKSVAPNTLRAAALRGDVLALSTGRRAALHFVFRASLESWAPSSRGRRGKYARMLPRRPEDSLTLRELAARTGIGAKAWGVWLATRIRVPGTPLRRRPVSAERGGRRGHLPYAYWWEGA